MVRKLIEWAVNSPFIVILLAGALACFGIYAYTHVNVEAYPDPAPAIIEVLAQYPGYSAEEVERLITIPLEIALAGMPGLQYTRSKSLAGLSHLRNQFEYGVDYYAARQEVLNRLNSMPALPGNVTPQISPFTPTGELVRYSIKGSREALERDDLDQPRSGLFGRYTVSDRPGYSGREVYSLLDLKALEDWTLEREFKRLPRIADVTSFGGMVKRYEVCPDPERLKRYGVTLQQFQNAVTNANANTGAGFVVQGGTAQNVRGIGLFGLGRDPMVKAQAMTGKPYLAANYLHEEGRRRVEEIREVVVVAVNNVPVRVKDLVTGANDSSTASPEGVSVNYVPRLGKVSMSRPKKDDAGQDVRDADGNLVWIDDQDVIQGIVLMRKNEATLPSLEKVHAKIKELNETPGALLPDTQIQLHFDLSGLLHVTTETVQENLILGMTLVTVILLMFISNVRCAIIVALNIPLALLFAFSVLFIRGKSANLLSIGAVDFGIIVDSSVIMVENIYRHLASGEYAELSLKDRIIRACHEVEKPLFFSTAIMVCAFIPLFTMHGPEGQIFGPMADTYAFALGGALLLAVTVAPVLCLLLLRNLKPARDNLLVRYLKSSYLRQLDRCLRYRWVTLGLFVALTLGTVALLPYLGQEFMPELEEGNFYVRATFPVNVSLEEAADKAPRARAVMRKYPEVNLIQSQVGRPDDGTDPCGFFNVEFSLPLRPEGEWPAVVEQTGWRAKLFGSHRARTKPELKAAMNEELNGTIPGVDWNFSQYIRDNVMESLSGVKGDNSVKIIGPDLDELERLAVQFKAELDKVPGVENVGIFRIMGQPNLEFTIDRKKCSFWSVSVQDVQNAIKIAVGGSAVTQMVEGEKTFDIALRWPGRLRGSEQAILDIPVEVSNNTVTQGMTPSIQATPVSGAAVGVSTIGTVVPMPTLLGNVFNAAINNLSTVPRLRLRHLVSPVNADGQLDPNGSYLRVGASTIYREQGKRLIAVKFSVNNSKRDLGGAVAEAQERTAPLLPTGYKTEWSGEFQEMKEAQARLMVIVPVSLALICVLLYLAFHNLLDVLAILSNVLALCMGGVWALLLTGNNFSISAAVGFISIFGVAIMDGLLLVSYFNHLRAQGLPLREAILQGAEKRVRPVMMTALTAIFGLLPAALSTRIGAQTQRPLAIVVVGGMISTLFLTRYLMPVLYSFYGHREPTQESGGLAH